MVRNRERELLRAGLADESVTRSKSDLSAWLCSAKPLSSGIWRPQMVRYIYHTLLLYVVGFFPVKQKGWN